MKQFWKKTVINLVLFVLLFTGVIVFVLIPTYKKYSQDKIVDAKKKTTVEENSAKISSLQNISKDSKDFDKIYENVNNFWPDNPNVSEFMVQIEGLAKDTGLIIDGFSMQEQKATATKATSADDSSSATPKTKTTANTSTKFTMSFKSEYSNVLDLILRMETLARLNAISSISISAGEKELSASIIGDIYYGK